MGICLSQYRVVIGLFNRCKFVKSGFSFIIRGTTINILFILFIACICHLILAGDIETNPGPPKCKNLRICHTNVRSLSRSKFLGIKTSLTELYDIITISETHVHAGVPNNLFCLSDFHEIIRNDRAGEGGGVAVFVRDSITYKRIFQYEKPNIEAIWLQISSIEGKVLVCSCYRPPKDNNFWAEFAGVLDEVKEDHTSSVIILGDLNADLSMPNGRKLSQLCDSHNFAYLVNEPTRITDNTATILDQIIVNCPNFVRKVEVSPPVSTSDHCTVGIHLSFKIKKEAAYERKIWIFKDADFDKFRNALLTTDFNQCFEDNNVNVACSKWTETFLSVANETIPNKKVIIRPNDSPWYTSELRTMRRRMLRAYHKFKSTKRENDWASYKTLKNEYHHGLDEAEAAYKQSLSSSLEHQRNSKRWWQTVKWLLGKGGDTSYPSLNINDKNINLNKEKAEAFNNFFLSHSSIDESNAVLPDDNEFPEGISNIVATENEVHDLLKCIDPSKSTGPDGVSPRLLKEAGVAIVPSLTKLMNLSLSSATVPDSWKLAHVIPLFKKGEKSEVNNYRPVSLLSCVSKILERVVFKHIFNYLRDSHFLSEHQSGFQPGDSTVNQLCYLYHTFCEALDNKKDVYIVFCDVRKAFDRVWHKGLLYKLRKAGICGLLLAWFENYLKDRYQQVVIRGEKSEIGLIRAGVPQGSVLGPLLFLVYINDLTSVTQCKIKLFADDTSLYIDFDNSAEAEEALNNDMLNIQNWANQWLVSFSPVKTKLMTCSFKNTQPATVVFDNTQIESVQNHRHLGLILSHDLTWSCHVQSLIQSVSPLIDVLKKLKHSLDRRTLETIYFSFIRPKLEYGCHIWDNCSKHDSDLLEGVQLDMARVITGARRGTSHALLYKETNWQLLSERRENIKLKNFIKIVNNDSPLYLSALLPKTFGELRPNTRNPNNYIQFKARTETFSSSFFPSSIRLWNTKPLEERTVEFIMCAMKRKGNELYNFGNRSENIKHSQLRLNCSKLNSHLHMLHVQDSPACPCGHNYEDVNHFLLHCPLYIISRQKMLQSIARYVNGNITADILLFGMKEATLQTNSHIFKTVHDFIVESGRL